MSYLKAIAKTKEENKKNNKKKDSVDWNKNAMDYISKVDGLFMQTKGVEKMYQTNTTKPVVKESKPRMGNGGTKPVSNFRLEESQKFTVAPAYNKGAYQVITKTNIKDIGR